MRPPARPTARWPWLLMLGAGLPAAAALGWAASAAAARRGRKEDSRPAGAGGPGRHPEALALLSASQPEVRVGAIYALEHAATRSADDHPVVMSVLAAFVREHSHPAQPDVQAALTVLGRRASERDREPIDLTGADLARLRLPGADLAGARLARARFRAADLHGAVLGGADLTGADLAYADLAGADLAGANLTAADLTGARLTGAYLVGATLTRATLADADLTGALFLHSDAQAAGWAG
ncbi:MAG TPA: pentapeptide repeat-containing protein [Streptosporangiaceae bacterium]|nr:pentapeptide repeat-containing protein [Streptosporangiaceae bacterium]